MSKFNPAQFVREVRQETGKVTWPTRKEVGITTMMIFIMVTLVAIFLFLVHQVIGWVVRMILNLGG